VNFDLPLIGRALPVLAKGAVVTVELSALAIALALVWGLVIVGLRLSRFRLLAGLAAAYVEALRNTPVLVQMYFLYFGLALAGWPLSGFVAGLLALVLQNGAYISEIYRAGIQSVAKVQAEAGLALGMRPIEAFRIVVFPQALRRVVPPFANQFVLIIKDTALVSTLSVAEMTFEAKLLTDRTAAAYEIFTALALAYLLVTAAVGLAMRGIERRVAVAG
jgi:polar amino acid transport system permease protein